tara:strand:+ start:1542 stop:2189 length:648 start_codon:yes stop_codon:yes gene_type:complete
MTNEERDNILDQHKTVYDGYVTSYVQPEKNQPLYVQDYANDKQGITVSNKGVVTGYKNMNINEMKYDGKSTGLFSKEEPTENHISPGSQFEPEESFESEDKDDDYYVSLGEQLDMIGDGEDDLKHGTFDDDDSDMVLVSPDVDFDEEDEFMDYDGDDASTWPGANYGDDDNDELMFNLGDKIFDDEDDIDDEEVEGLFDDLRESLDMFKRFTKYN